MVLNYIWIGFFVIAFIIALLKVIFLGDTEIFTAIMNSTFDSSKTAFEISLGLTGVLALWLGIMKIGENSGLINALARFLSPVLCRLFPDIPKGHPVLGSIFMNMSANMLGLDNAATPLGLKAMKELQELNPKKDTASNPMIMFLVINTSGLIIIPISIMVYRAQMGAAQPTDVFIPMNVLADEIHADRGADGGDVIRAEQCDHFGQRGKYVLFGDDDLCMLGADVVGNLLCILKVDGVGAHADGKCADRLFQKLCRDGADQRRIKSPRK